MTRKSDAKFEEKLIRLVVAKLTWEFDKFSSDH